LTAIENHWVKSRRAWGKTRAALPQVELDIASARELVEAAIEAMSAIEDRAGRLVTEPLNCFLFRRKPEGRGSRDLGRPEIRRGGLSAAAEPVDAADRAAGNAAQRLL
jgi:hypothetical protein